MGCTRTIEYVRIYILAIASELGAVTHVICTYLLYASYIPGGKKVHRYFSIIVQLVQI